MSSVTKLPPKMPVAYDEAVKALDACLAIDEAKCWSDKADALAAWAKIYRNDIAGRRAKQLKLHAYRRMGVLAGELRPRKALGNKKGWSPGPLSLLKEQGLNISQADSARKLASISAAGFIKIVEAPKPLSPMAAKVMLRLTGSDSWRLVAGSSVAGNPMSTRGFGRKHKAKELARGLIGDEVEKAREIATECEEWLDEFLQHLPKQKRSK